MPGQGGDAQMLGNPQSQPLGKPWEGTTGQSRALPGGSEVSLGTLVGTHPALVDFTS